jgi:hypothetical protein
MAKGRNLITCEIHSPEPNSNEAAIRQADKRLVDFFLLLNEWNEEAKREDAAEIQKDI